MIRGNYGFKPSAPANSQQTVPQYFSDNRRAEVHELRNIIRPIISEKNNAKRRDVLKRVIAYMTLGIDISNLFGEIVLMSATDDPIQKKMVYLFFTTYAESNAELAILTINTLQKDCRDQDHIIRGLALRSLTNLRLSNVYEYIEKAVRNGLNDTSGYVRGCAVIGCVKLFQIIESCPEDIISLLYKLLDDEDCTVSSNAIVVLNEILKNTGGIKVTKKIVVSLLNRIKSFNEWGQCNVLGLLCSYVPSSDDELFCIMDLIDSRLRTNSASVIMACIKCFVNLVSTQPKLFHAVLERIRSPLLILISTTPDELTYSILLNVKLLLYKSSMNKDQTIMGGPSFLSEAYEQFYCRYTEPSYLKAVKIDLLKLVATNSNFGAITTEIYEYVSDADSTISKRAISALGAIAFNLPLALSSIVQMLRKLMELSVDYVLSSTVCVIKKILQKFPEVAESLVQDIRKCVGVINDPYGDSAVIWILGKFGNLISEAPYLLETFVDSYSSLHSGHVVRNELITSTIRLFFQRPPEMQPILGKLLYQVTQDFSNPDIHDRGLFILRMLQKDINLTKQVISSSPHRIQHFAEQDQACPCHLAIEDFDTLIVSLNQPLNRITFQQQTLKSGRKASIVLPVRSEKIYSGNLMDSEIDADPDNAGVNITDRFKKKTLQLIDEPVISPDAFQAVWLKYSGVERQFLQIGYRPLPNLADLEKVFEDQRFFVMASGTIEGPTHKMYLYCREETGNCVFIEVMLNHYTAVITVKSDSEQFSNRLIEDVFSHIWICLNSVGFE